MEERRDGDEKSKNYGPASPLHGHQLSTPSNCVDPNMLRACIFVGLAASAEAFQPVGAARVRGTSFAPTPWRRASPAVALELRGEHGKKCLAPRLREPSAGVAPGTRETRRCIGYSAWLRTHDLCSRIDSGLS